MTGTTAELRTMSLADLATVQRKIAAELSRRLTGRHDRRQDDRTPDAEPHAAGSLDLQGEPDAYAFW